MASPLYDSAAMMAARDEEETPDEWSEWIDLGYAEEGADTPSYPPGMRIALTDRELTKAGLPMPAKGDLLDLRAFGEVTSISDGEFGQRVEVQLIRIKVENEMTEE